MEVTVEAYLWKKWKIVCVSTYQVFSFYYLGSRNVTFNIDIQGTTCLASIFETIYISSFSNLGPFFL
ncbi:hypothetical protein VNO78_10706 [Psophocarpus tetragonolobus]|uniref:Uncharacterized protein n=1 Tax=Psophocarpus tetragonolobus TaxID=3891 RepID=A0AAN9XMS2_PSOTE